MHINRRSFLLRSTRGKPSSRPPHAITARPSTQRNTNLNDQQLTSRFLAQATLGPTLSDIDKVASTGIESWIDQQFTIPQTELLTYMWNVIDKVYRIEGVPLLGLEPFRWAWWQAVMTGEDLLRQRVAMALSEIFVISTRTDVLEDASTAVGYFYDILSSHTFGNFRDLLYDVTLSPAMGYYLSHASNRKSDPATNRFPDENYAREVMQLFSIGLFELNIDGTHKLDSSGNSIPTYNNNDIKEFAKIFTGLTYQPGEWWEDEDIGDPSTEDGFLAAEVGYDNASLPMTMHEQFHEPGQKHLLNGFVVPGGQTGLKDISDAIDNLFNHPNVGPFISRLLIQRMVKSQPSPAYIARVATTFNDNGNGVRGDMKAVVKAILLDDEARNTTFINDPTHGMLREPFVRYTQLCRAFEAKNVEGENLFYNAAWEQETRLGQYPFASPSVFNFFSPDFKPLGPLEQAHVVAPEFQIMTSVTTVNIANLWEDAIFHDELMNVPEGADPEEPDPHDKLPNISYVTLDLTPYESMEDDIDGLIERLDLLLTYGTLSNEMHTIINTALTGLYNRGADWDEVVRFAIYLFMNCPDYTILK